MAVNDHIQFNSAFNRMPVILGLTIPLILNILIFHIQESNEARQKFTNAKSISSAQFFGDQVKPGDREAQISLQKYSVCPFFKNIFVRG